MSGLTVSTSWRAVFVAAIRKEIKEPKFFRSLLLFLAPLHFNFPWLILSLLFALWSVGWVISAAVMLRWCLGIRGHNWLHSLIFRQDYPQI